MSVEKSGESGAGGVLDRTALVLRFLGGDATSQERALVEELLVSDKGFVEEYLAICQLDVGVEELVTSAAGGKTVAFPSPPSPSPPAPVSAWGSAFQSWQTLMALSVVCAALGGLASWFLRIGVDGPQIASVDAGPGQSSPIAVDSGQVPAASGQNAVAVDPSAVVADQVAKVTMKVDCVWDEERRSVGKSFLSAGEVVSLTQGILGLELLDGTTLELHGPLRLKFLAARQLFLGYGLLSVDVPEGAEGLAVDTPSATLVDHGTTFDVRCDDGSKVTQVHVHEGKVMAQARMGLVEKRMLNQGAVWRSDAGTVGASGTTMTSIRSVAATPVPQFGASPVLHLSAHRGVTIDSMNRVSKWADQAIVENQSDDSAWQLSEYRQPKLVENAFGELPGIRFDGERSWLATSPFTVTSDHTTCMLFSVGGAGQFGILDGQRNNVINFNGPPNFVLETRWNEPRMRLVGRVFSEENVPALEGLDWGERAWIETNVVSHSEPILCTYVYSASEGRATMFVNGVKQGDIPVSVSAGQTSAKYIGSRYVDGDCMFLGDIAEILVFNSALSDEQVGALEREISALYGLD